MDTRAYAERLTLDPASDQDWQELRQLGHRMLDDLFDAQQSLSHRPAWRPLPESKAALFTGPGPEIGLGAELAYEQFRSHVFPYGNGNWHPRFFGWVQGNGTPLAMLADMLASGMNPHLAGFNQAPARVERQVLDWFSEWMGMPGASGLFVTGGTMANVHGLACARMAMAARLDRNARRDGMQCWPEGADDAPAVTPGPMVFYGSTETHSWATKAAEWLGLGNRAFRRVPVTSDRRLDMQALAACVARDRAHGLVPFAVIGTAGTVNTGTTDPLDDIASFCASESLWFHVDGAFGALLALTSRYRHVVHGMERADSLAFDLHKWGSMPFECAVALIRDPAAHAAAFRSEAAYLGALPRGVSAGGQHFNDIGLDLTRGFKALKIWMQLKADGVAKLGAVIEQNIEQVQYLARMVDSHEECERVADAPLNILCFRYVPPSDMRAFADEAERTAYLNDLNREVLMRLQERGIATPSSTVLDGRFVLRVAHVNHRTTDHDIETLCDSVVEIGREVAEEMRH